jgi:hypothetical protein
LDIFVILVKEIKGGVINLSPIYEHLKKRGCFWKGQWIVIEGIPVDIIPADALEKEAVESAQDTEYEGAKTKVITPEYLVVLLLRAGRNKDIRKIEMLLEQAKIDMGNLDKILKKYRLDGKFNKFREKRHGR